MALEFRIQFLMKSKNMFKFRILIDPHNVEFTNIICSNFIFNTINLNLHCGGIRTQFVALDQLIFYNGLSRVKYNQPQIDLSIR